MAKSKKPSDKASTKSERVGPFLAVAIIAEKVLIEDDKAATLVRVIDQVGIQADPTNLNGKLVALDLVLFISFKAGGFKGKATISFVQVGPSEINRPLGTSIVTFDGTQNGGANVKGSCMIVWEGEGQYFYDVFLDNRFFTRIPFRVGLGVLPQPEKKKR